MTAPFQLTDAEAARVTRIDELVARGSVEALVADLADASWTVRRAVIAGLASLGDDAVTPLCDWLRYRRTSEAAIAAAVDTLVASRGRSVTEHVTALLHDARADVAADAAAILGRRRTTEAVGDLRRAALNVDDNVALAAIEALGRIGGAGGIDTLIAATRSDNFFRVFAAVQVLATIGDPRAVEPLTALLADPMHRASAIAALGRTGSVHAVPALAEVATRAADDELLTAGAALADLITHAAWNGSAERVVDVLRASLDNVTARFATMLPRVQADDATKLAAVIGWLGTTAELPALAALVGSPLHDAVLAAIAQIVQRNEHALPELLAHEDARVRLAVIPIARSRSAAPAIRALLEDELDDVRVAACEALGRLGDTDAVPRLFARLEDRPRVALAATAAIHSLHTTDTEPRTLAVLRDGSPAARRHALRIISYLGLPHALPAVRAAIADPDQRISELAIATLGSLAGDAAVEDLHALLAADRPEATRAAAMRALASRGTAPEVLARFLDDGFAWVRYYAVQGLGRAAYAPAVPALVSKLRDPSPQVRLAAIEALSSIDAPAAETAVLAAARSQDPDEQRAALLGIGNSSRATGLPILLVAARAPDIATRIIALSGLGKHADGAAIQALIDAALAPEPEVRDAAVSLLAERTDRAAADALADVAAAAELGHPIHTALSVPSPARISALRQRCASADERTALTFATALGRMRDARATAALLELVAVPNAVSRRVAATVLVEIGLPGARELVARMSREDPDPAVRRACAASAEGLR